MSGQAFTIKMLGGEWATQMSCQDAGCAASREGWVSVLDTTNPQMAAAATWIKQASGRKFYEWRGEEALEAAHRSQAFGELTVTPELQAMLTGLTPEMVAFYFLPGQQCFKEHLDREVKFLHQTRRGAYEHTRPLDFNEDFNITADRLHILRQRG